MTPVAILLAAFGTALLAITLAGLLMRGGWRTWYAFTAYLAITSAFTTAVLLRPEVFYVPQAWTLEQNVVNAVRFAVALELAARTFYSFPGARSTLRLALLVVLTATLVMVGSAASGAGDYQSFLEELQPRLLNGTVLVFTSIAALILWYRLPVARLHKSIVLGYVPYLLFQLVYLHVFVTRSWETKALAYLNQAAYLLLVSYWARVAWRRPDPPRAAQGGPQAPPGSLERVAAA